jgi:hypothetical protein
MSTKTNVMIFTIKFTSRRRKDDPFTETVTFSSKNWLTVIQDFKKCLQKQYHRFIFIHKIEDLHTPNMSKKKL